MSDLKSISERQTPREVFNDVFLQTSTAVNALGRLSKTRTDGTRGIPRTPLRIGYAVHAQSDTEGPVILSTHVSVMQHHKPRTLVSVTDYFPAVPSRGQPFSVGVYRGEEKYPDHPDFFIKQEQQSGANLVVMRLGAAGIHGNPAENDDIFGESTLAPDALLLGYSEFERYRLGIVVQGICNGLVALERLKQGEDSARVLSSMHP